VFSRQVDMGLLGVRTPGRLGAIISGPEQYSASARLAK
jgi:hypothetical protein